MSVKDAPDVNLDRLLTNWLEADAAPRAPESLETAFVERLAATRQRPAWATTERWISMETRAQLGVVPRVAIVLLTIALLSIGAIGGYAIGSGLVDASDGGDPLAGLTYSTYDGDVYTHPTGSPGEPVRLTGADEGAFLPRWSPDGTRFAYQSWAGRDGPITMTVRDADGSNPVAVGEPIAPHSRGTKPNIHAWSPDGSRLVYAAERLDDTDELADADSGSGARPPTASSWPRSSVFPSWMRARRCGRRMARASSSPAGRSARSTTASIAWTPMARTSSGSAT